MGGTPNGLKQFLLQGRTTIKENVFQNCLRSYPLWEGMMDFPAWVGSKITHGCFYLKPNHPAILENDKNNSAIKNNLSCKIMLDVNLL
ncbi:hypothetical protein [Bacillus alveayuensis]|uniref:hypothetical protein n=1 Tax=Aeribacillus alveayuensis TaxID=279215 RepID=UPI0005D12C43|nr:hypothetical protein [Bacillus alveayuensis]